MQLDVSKRHLEQKEMLYYEDKYDLQYNLYSAYVLIAIFILFALCKILFNFRKKRDDEF